MRPGESGAVLDVTASAPGRSKGTLALAILGVVLVLDVLTKWWVVQNFALYDQVPVLGDWLRLTYTHNPGAAFGINVGEHSRIFFLVLSLVALGVLAFLYRATPAADRLRIVALSLVGGGALGNILDRIRYERGVVDFIDVGIGSYRWPVFNVADMAVSTGAVLLLISFYTEEQESEVETEADDAPADAAAAQGGR